MRSAERTESEPLRRCASELIFFECISQWLRLRDENRACRSFFCVGSRIACPQAPVRSPGAIHGVARPALSNMRYAYMRICVRGGLCTAATSPKPQSMGWSCPHAGRYAVPRLPYGRQGLYTESRRRRSGEGWHRLSPGSHTVARGYTRSRAAGARGWWHRLSLRDSRAQPHKHITTRRQRNVGAAYLIYWLSFLTADGEGINHTFRAFRVIRCRINSCICVRSRKHVIGTCNPKESILATIQVK